jgi:hypothetical protein
VLFGHLHVRVRHRLRTEAGALDVIGASGAALDHPSPSIRAGYNVYAIADDGSLAVAEARAITTDGRTLEPVPLVEGRRADEVP